MIPKINKFRNPATSCSKKDKPPSLDRSLNLSETFYMPQYQAAYFVMDILLGIVWAFLFIKRKDLRREMLTMSFLIAAWLGISGYLFFNEYIIDYWNPQYLGFLHAGSLFWRFGLLAKGIEDILFIFFFSGISAVIYEEILGKKQLRKGRKSSLKLLLLFPAIMFISYAVVTLTGILNIIYGDFIGYSICAAIVWYFRKDLIRHSLISGLSMGTFFFLFYFLIYVRIYPGIFHAWWILNKTSGIFLLGIPLEEILWAFFIGLWVGPTYELLIGLKDDR